jgi:hypothetical protein
MNGNEQFEQRLRRQQMPRLPSAWREEILAIARDADHASRITHRELDIARLLLSLSRQLSTRLSPHPGAWGALAAVWIALAVANVASREPDAGAAQFAAPLPQVRELLKQQGRLLTELVGELEVERPGPVPRRPHSRAREEFRIA